jgi:septal ring factor EnvC (AmiA/AmiB activator)
MSMKDAVGLQKQISVLKQSLEQLAAENRASKASLSELSLKTEELKVCSADLAKAQQSKKRCEKWADELDTEKSEQAAELSAADAKIAEEQRLLDNALRVADETAHRLDAARTSLHQIEEQKNASITRLREKLKVPPCPRRSLEPASLFRRAPLLTSPAAGASLGWGKAGREKMAVFGHGGL